MSDILKEIEDEIVLKCFKAIEDSREKIYTVIHKYLSWYYAEHSPSAYDRTWKLFKSLVQTTVVKSGNTIKAEVYFDASKLDYEQGQTDLRLGYEWHAYGHEDNTHGWATWDSENVLDTALYKGTHGGNIQGTAIWTSSMKEIGDINALIKKELIANGLSVR